MILKHLAVEGITRFRAPVEIDFDAIGPGLVALVGPNGAGKTTLLECSAPAALWRELPTRPDPALQNWIGPRGGSLRLAFASGGHEYISHLKYPAKGTATAVLYVGGTPVTSGKLKDYDAAILERFGKPEAFYASAFAAQGGRGRFAALSVSDRKSIFRFYLGLGRVDAIHTSAKAALARVDLARAERLGREAEDLRRRVPGLKDAIASAASAVADATTVRDFNAGELARAEKDSALSAAVAAYQRALMDVLASDERVAALRAAAAAASASIPAKGDDADALAADLEQASAAAAEFEALCRDLDEAAGMQAEAERIVADAEMRADEMTKVPCGGEGAFAACKFLQEAREAWDRLPSLRETLGDCTELVQIREAAVNDTPEPPPGQVASLRARHSAALAARRSYEAALGRAETAGASLEAALEAAKAARKRGLALRRSLPDPIPDVPTPEAIDEKRRAARWAQAELDGAVRRKAAAEAELTAALGRMDEVADAIESEKAAATDGEALALLVRGFGPSGIQALEIDASGPKVSELSNELVQACYGDRFSLEIRTQRELKSRDGVGEDFAIHVIDSERGREGSLGSLSGGEQVVVDEALRTALALFAVGSRAGVEVSTLWRDELPAALYGENIAKYLAMLHRARSLGGFHQILFVGGEDVLASADAVIHVGADGSVVVGSGAR